MKESRAMKTMQKKQSKKTLNLKTYNNPGTKNPEDLGHNKNSKHMNIRNKGREQTHVKVAENIFNILMQKNPKSKAGDAHQGIRSIPNTKQVDPEKKFFSAYK